MKGTHRRPKRPCSSGSGPTSFLLDATMPPREEALTTGPSFSPEAPQAHRHKSTQTPTDSGQPAGEMVHHAKSNYCNRHCDSWNEISTLNVIHMLRKGSSMCPPQYILQFISDAMPDKTNEACYKRQSVVSIN